MNNPTNAQISQYVSPRHPPILTHTLPFAVFALFTYLPLSQGWSYPLKTVVVGLMLMYFWPSIRHEIRWTWDWPAVVVGVAVFLIWIGLEGHTPKLGGEKALSPWSLDGPISPQIFIGFRLIGACLVVPIMEELFWRSFALRFLITSKIHSVPVGTFTWFSFVVVSLAFGLEHNRWIPGILAGMAFAGLLYRTHNLFSPILAHAITNALLGIYVLSNSHWHFW